MNPIFTVQNDKNLSGYWYSEFEQQFDDICNQHLKEGRAKAFAFIVYDFNSPIHKTLQDQGVFTELDRLSGENITIFYLDGQLGKKNSSQTQLYENFNKVLIELSGKRVRNIPFIVFFDFVDGDVTRFESYPIRDNEKLILNDLVKAVKNKLEKLNSKKLNLRVLIPKLIGKTVKETPKILYSQFIKMLLENINY